MSRLKLYIGLLSISLASYFWIFYSFHSNETSIWKGCLLKQFAHIPCPACGTTRAIRLLLGGDIKGSFLLNPNVMVVLCLITFIPCWVISEFTLQKNTLYCFYHQSGTVLRNHVLLFFLFLLYPIHYCFNIF